ncbi:hypothetical protein LXM25_09935 [Dyadobacter sp. LJ53]|uniref:hypothetical protein n=1 Tax=Dyadobacter chenwenxiniae TaxID=2906456 RepID=UPI001F173390|nr:hypothetical protein [Dyadobacter chenwenxiniae]MCF0050377.1 hypothetical protein [Dyadobacter chenwenxiniae]
MKNRQMMTKIVRILVFFCLSTIFWDCKKNDPEPDGTNPFDAWKFEGETTDRPGPGYSWRLSVDDQSGANGYLDLAGDRLFYLNASGEGTREVILTVTKREESSADPSFRIYGRLQQCLLMSAPRVSSGNFTASKLFERESVSNSAKYSGMTWTPALAKSPVNSKATYKFKVYIDSKDSLCTEGFVQVDMVAPAVINSAGSYSDGDHLYFIKRR